METTFRSWYERKMLATPELVEETELVKHILTKVRTIAIVGISKNRHKDSHYVGRYLQYAGYRIVPVNPTADRILGEKAYPDLKSVPFQIDAIDIFRKPEDIPSVIDEALTIDAPVIWLQLGTGIHPKEKARVERSGKTFIQNRCMKVDHQFLMRASSNQLYKSYNHREEIYEHQR
jgi:uncharacterized protein